jgi:membrane associated rhomboid family serine protease
LIPLSDNLPTLRTPWVTYILLASIGAVWVLVQGAGLDQRTLASSVCQFGMIPGELTGGQAGRGVPLGPGVYCAMEPGGTSWLTPLTSMFMHGGWMHLIGNALFLWVFGNNVEDSMGHVRFVLFYLVCGLAAAAAHVLLNVGSVVPTVGASGAISGVMGGYLLLYPRARVNMLFIIIIIIRIIPLPAWLVLLWWFGLQLLMGLPELMQVDRADAGGVAFGAHIGGFVAGVALIHLFARKDLVDAHRQTHGRQFAWRRS